MKLHIIAVGRWRECPERALWQEYTKRLGWECSLKEVEVKQTLPADKLKIKEAELLLAAVPEGAAIIALDEYGKQLTSPQFAEMIQTFQLNGRDIAFLIGGASGHGEAVLKKAERKLSLGAMTWPHMMVRAMLSEQIYRAHAILSGHPYHRG